METDSITSLFTVYRYDSTTGIFTEPSGGEGFYFSVFFLVADTELGYFDIQINDEMLCTAHTDQQQSSLDPGQASCTAAIHAAEGYY